MAQKKVLGNQLNITDVATETANDATAIGTLSAGIVADPTAIASMEAGIDHANLGAGIGTKSHVVIDSHIDDASLHFTEASIIHQNISGKGSNDHPAIDAHIASFDIHLIPEQNTYLDTLTLTGSPALTGADTNQLIGITGNVQVLIDAVAGDLTTHENLDTVHLTTDQNAFLDGLTLTGSPALTSIDVNQLIGIASNVQAQIDLKANDVVLTAHLNDISGNPHAVTAAEVGLGNVDDTSDINKPLSTASINALALKTDKVLTTVVGNFASFSDITGTQQDSTFSDASFATAAQGTTADSALQPAAIGVTVEAYNANIQAHIIDTANPHSTTLNLLTDVNVAGATLGQVLTLAGSPPMWTAATPSAGGSQTPWTSDIDAAGFSLITSDITSVVDADSLIINPGDNESVVVLGGSPPTAIRAGSLNLYAGSTTKEGKHGDAYNGILADGVLPGQVNIKGGTFNITNYGGYATYADVFADLGNVNIFGGENISTATYGYGGFVQIIGGKSSATGGYGGGVRIVGGQATYCGSVSLLGGPGVLIEQLAGSPYQSFTTIGHGGSAYLKGGYADSTNNAGSISIYGGDIYNSGSGYSGTVRIRAGRQFTGTPGKVIISTPGNSNTTTVAGEIDITAGATFNNDTALGADINITAGRTSGGTNAATSKAGTLNLFGGGGTATSQLAFGGDVYIRSGGGGNGTAGDIILQTGSSGTGGAQSTPNITFREGTSPNHAKFRLQSGSGTGNFFTTVGMSTNLVADTLFQLPPNNGAVDDVLTTDGAGVTTWAKPNVAESFLKASLPAQQAGRMIYVSDATGSNLVGSLCFSNGTVWIDVTTGVAVA